VLFAKQAVIKITPKFLSGNIPMALCIDQNILETANNKCIILSLADM